jgi:uncharacterized protein YjbI with pentapeptide repeats
MRRKVLAAAAALVGLLPPAVTEAKSGDCSETALVPRADLRRCDLRPLAVATLDLDGADMRRATLSHMALGGGADGPRTNFTGVRLDRADASSTAFADLDLTGASLRYADLRATGWEDTTARNADLTGADLRGASLTFGGFSGASFRWRTCVTRDSARSMRRSSTCAPTSAVQIYRAPTSPARRSPARASSARAWSAPISAARNSDSRASVERI